MNSLLFGRYFFALACLVAASMGLAAEAKRAEPSPAEEITALRSEIARHDELYHRKAAPEISDHDYDQLKRRLRELERLFPALTTELPARSEIGDDRSGLFATFRHRVPMLSLDKAYEPAELRAFHTRLAKLLGRDDLAYSVEPKFDGIAVSATYENGLLVRAVTRGNGIEGDDVTANIRAIAGFRPGFGGAGPFPAVVELRGEIYVPFAEFARVNSEREAAGEAPFANPRNLAAGTVRQRDPRELPARGLCVVFYGFGACEPAAARPATQRGLHVAIAGWGLPAIERTWPARGVAELLRAVEALRAARASFGFPTDGAVVKLDAVAQQQQVGAGENAPRWAVAYKFAPERVETRVRAITVQVGRTGVLTPVAELEPAGLGGSTIVRVTLHNRDEIARLDVRVGDFVVIEKAGEIIPALVAVNHSRRATGSSAFVFPDECPACGSAVVARLGEAARRCDAMSCPAQRQRRIEHFASRDCVAIAGLGPATVAAIVNAGLVRDVADLYALRNSDLESRAGLGAKTSAALIAAIERSKRVELWRLVYGLGIPQVGAVGAREVAQRCGSLDDLLACDENAGAAERAVARHFAHPANREVVERLRGAGVMPTAFGQAEGKRKLAGNVFVLTGQLETMTRTEAADRIRLAGGVVSDAVTRNTSYVVAGAVSGAKRDAAERLGVPIIDEATLLALLAEP